ncbi:nitroreductase family protein [Planctomonas psychrotolerans]|uniref:nitroreductase family protein n=1 Tax=Planctomonas psychrotolerans TaxID=2528712 RepID=UPI00123A6CF8|nr:nitroreductase family protein [Planctomonas psychrotolerans]
MLPTTATDRRAETSVPLVDVLAERWSPRAFDPDGVVSDEQLTAALEAARWTPSLANGQPSRFVVGRRGDDTFAAILDSLAPGNAEWAHSATVLVANVAEVTDENGAPRTRHEYDLGQAVAHFTVQAHADGLHVHQMAGFSAEALRESFGIPARFEPLTVSALGVLGEADTLPERVRARESAPRSRKPLGDLVHRGTWN